MFKPIGSLIKTSSIRSPKSSEALLALQVRQVTQEVLSKNLADLPGEVIKLLKLVSYKKGLLVVSCPPIIAAELSMRSGGLVDDINRAFGKRILTSIKFKIH